MQPRGTTHVHTHAHALRTHEQQHTHNRAADAIGAICVRCPRQQYTQGRRASGACCPLCAKLAIHLSQRRRTCKSRDGGRVHCRSLDDADSTSRASAYTTRCSRLGLRPPYGTGNGEAKQGDAAFCNQRVTLVVPVWVVQTLDSGLWPEKKEVAEKEMGD